MDIKKATVKSKAEAVLFCAGRKMSLDEISKLCRSKREDVITSLQELKKEYDEKQSSIMIVEEGDFWKFSIRDHLIPIARKIITETELPKSVVETLAVIAFKYPILQSDLIKIRTNKAYDHLTELEAAGYISRQKHGRTNLIKLTDKFFKYFDLTEDNLKDKFKDFESIAKAIKDKEVEVENLKEEKQKQAEELKKEDERIKKEIEILDETDEVKIPVQVYGEKSKEVISEEFTEEGNLVIEKRKVGELEIIESENTKKPRKEKLQSKQIEKKDEKKENKEKDIKINPEMEAKVAQRVEEILQPEKETK